MCQSRLLQASPANPDNFPFVVLGNKVDMDEGRSRVVRSYPFCSQTLDLFEKLQVDTKK